MNITTSCSAAKSRVAFNKGQAARGKEQAARVKAWAAEKVNAKKAGK